MALVAQHDVRDLLGRLPDDCVAVVHAESAERVVAALAAAAGPLPENLPPEVAGWIGAGLVAVRATLRGSIQDTAALLAGDGLAMGLLPDDGSGQIVAALLPRDRDAALQWCERFAGRLFAAVVDDVLLVGTSARGLAKLQQQRTPGRWRDGDFGPALAGTVLRGAVDLERLRARSGEPVTSGAARFVLLPIVHALQKATRVSFDVAAERAITVELRADASVLGTDRAALLACSGRERSVLPLADDALLSLSFDRSVHALFGALERHLDPGEVLAVQGFLSIADALDGPRSSFVDDLLGGLEEPFVLHVMPATVDAAEPCSPLRLPEFAIVAGIGKANVDAVLFRFAQVFATIANAERVQRGRGAFRLRRIADESGTGFVAEPPEYHGPGLPPLDRQLAPTVWCGDRIVVLASTEAAARRIVASARAPERATVRGDVLELRGPNLAAALRDNRGPIELARMFDEGDDDVAAHRFVDVVLAVADALQRVAVTSEVEAGTTRVRVVLERRR